MDDSSNSSRKLPVLVLLLAIGAAVFAVLKKQRESELDEALWEEPKAL